MVRLGFEPTIPVFDWPSQILTMQLSLNCYLHQPNTLNLILFTWRREIPSFYVFSSLINCQVCGLMWRSFTKCSIYRWLRFRFGLWTVCCWIIHYSREALSRQRRNLTLLLAGRWNPYCYCNKNNNYLCPWCRVQQCIANKGAESSKNGQP